MEEHKERHTFFLNTTGISLVEFFWGLGLPLVLESTFLQLFLTRLGASNFIIGFIPTSFFIAQAFFGVISAYQSRLLERKRTMVIIYHIFPGLTIMVFGLYLLISGTFLPSTIFVFFIVYFIFNAGIGFILPVWQNYLVKLFSHDKVLPAFSIMMITQSAGRLLSSFFIAGFFTGREINAASSSALFIFCGAVFFIGSFGFLLTNEPDIPNDDNHTDSGFFKFVGESFHNIIKNRNIMLFLLSDIEMYAVITVISFYANYAVNCHGISQAAAAGMFIGFNYAGQIASNFILGTFNLFSIKTKCTLSRIFSMTGILLLLVGSHLAIFLASSVLLGISRAVRGLVYAPAIKKLSGKSDVTNYFAVAPIILLPLSTGISLMSGKLLDILPFAAIDAYRIVFVILGSLSFISIFIIRLVDFGTSSGTETKTTGL